MSVGQMSAALRNKILVQLEQAVRGNSAQITQRGLNAHIEYSSRERIRSETNARAESVMSRGGLESLKKDMQEYIGKNAVSSLGDNIVQQLDYEDFKNYLLKEYFKTEVKESKRVEDGYSYTQPIRLVGSRKATKLIIATSSSDASKDTLILKNIAYDKIVIYFKEYIKTKVGSISTTDAKALDEYMSKMFNAGHLAGVFTGRLLRAFDIKVSKTGSLTIGGSSDPELQHLFQNVLELITAADLLSSNIYNNVELFARSSKQLTKSSAKLQFVTEVQIGASNKEAGNLLVQAGNELSKLIKSIDPGVSTAGKQKAVGDYAKKLLEKLKPVREYVNTRSAQLKSSTKISKELEQELVKISSSVNTYDLLISTSGSASILDHISFIVLDTLDGKQRAKNEKSNAAVKKSLKPAKSVKKTVSKIQSKTVSAKIAKTVQQRSLLKQSISLANLQNLINSQLQDVISANMGDGNSRNVLNYRTGRFAASASVERMSESREGMITAFYSYMKNPYQTFEPGFKQGSPASRNPKLLISKSIREIAATQVGNRLRAVSI
jgi:hypothetical protein